MNETASSALTLRAFKTALIAAPAEANVSIILPSGKQVPAHYHVTEVGRIQKEFVDCGGRWHASQTCVLQTWIGSDQDDGHRLVAGRLAKILGLAVRLFDDESIPVEIEHEDGVISQYPLAAASMADGELVLRLEARHTDCLARKREVAEAGSAEVCGCGCGNATATQATCC